MRGIAASILLLATSLASPSGYGHGTGVTGTHVFDWHNDRIARVVSPGFSWNNLDRTLIAFPGNAVTEEGRQCLRASALNVDVRDAYGYDVAETVALKLVVDRATSPASFSVHYDRVGGPGRVEVTLPEGSERFVALTASLSNARLANRGDHDTDLMLATPLQASGTLAAPLTVCAIDVERSFTTPEPAKGGVALHFAGENGDPVAVRVGLYDADGGLPEPSTDAIAVRKFDDVTRTYLLQRSIVWPHGNRTVFYADGTYRANVPAGRYRLLATKGIEYRFLDTTVEVAPGRTTTKRFTLERFANMPAEGWLSGDVHIHSLRQARTDNTPLLAQVRAEDVHVANILKMGNVGRAYFPQYAWGRDGRHSQGSHALVPGQEDPRTLVLGHTIHLNLTQPIRFPDDYLNYQRVFEAAAAQGGVSGFAHGSGGLPGTTQGMTMQATTGLLDFAEVMQDSQIGTQVWYALLNLGFRIAPAAGTDYPYIDHPGAVRSYVHTGAAETPLDAWFAGLEQGRTFVTNGPLLRFSANDAAGMGETLRLARGDELVLKGSAALNPDIGRLVRLDVVSQGQVVASQPAASDKAMLTTRLRVHESGWYVLHAVGERPGHGAPIEAASAPVYVEVAGDTRTWKRDAVAAITTRLIGMLETVKHTAPEQVADSEAWHSMPVWQRDFARQLGNSRTRIDAAQKALRDLAEAAAR